PRGRRRSARRHAPALRVRARGRPPIASGRSDAIRSCAESVRSGWVRVTAVGEFGGRFAGPEGDQGTGTRSYRRPQRKRHLISGGFRFTNSHLFPVEGPFVGGGMSASRRVVSCVLALIVAGAAPVL